MHVDIKKSKSKFDPVQGHLRSRRDPGMSCCISVEASRREEYIEINHTALSLFYQKLEAKNVLDLN